MLYKFLAIFATSGLSLFNPSLAIAQDIGSALAGAMIGGIIVGYPTRSMAPSHDLNSKSLVIRLQNGLNKIGFESGTPDGIIGPKTIEAISKFQSFIGTDSTGMLTPAESEIILEVSYSDLTRPSVVLAIANAYCSGLSQKPNCLKEVNFLTSKRPKSIPTPRLTSFVVDRLLFSEKYSRLSEELEARRAYAYEKTIFTSNPIKASSRQSVQTFPDLEGKVALPTRMFAGPTQYPPKGFSGYGILAFTAEATTDDFFRHTSLCEAYMASLLPSSEISNPTSEQFVTVWPVRSDKIADNLNVAHAVNKVDDCTKAVENYDRIRSESAIKAAMAVGLELNGPGPYLLGWLPGDGYGKKETLILALNLSLVKSPSQARAMFAEWRLDIMTDPEIFRKTFSIELIRRKIRRWADIYGEGYLTMIGK